MALPGNEGAALRAVIVGLALIWGSAAQSMEAPRDVPGWRGIEWGMPLAEALVLFETARVLQERKTEIAGCYFRYAVPVLILGEEWDAWLCEDREDQTIVAVNMEKGYRGGFFFDETQTSSRILDAYFADMSDRFGPAQRHWRYCFNALGNPTEQFRWYFPSTTITFLYRDTGSDWGMVRFEPPTGRPEFGPGVCSTPPVDPRQE